MAPRQPHFLGYSWPTGNGNFVYLKFKRKILARKYTGVIITPLSVEVVMFKTVPDELLLAVLACVHRWPEISRLGGL